MIDTVLLEKYEPEITELYSKKYNSTIKRKHIHEEQIANHKPMFSICMCVYNHTDILINAINSVIEQTFEDWELIILDNGSSNKNAWEIIEKAMESDKRIYGIKGESNVGWAKGTSICLEYAKGCYMTFLAADDCLTRNSLYRVYNEIKECQYDIIWVGNASLSFIDEEVDIHYINIPEKRKWKYEDRVQASIFIMQNAYYNSMFNYIRIEFLKNHNIDFFYPYMGDHSAMTFALTKAKSMLVLDELTYCLTKNTSQTAGKYTWDSYEAFIFQWNSLKNMAIEDGVFDESWFRYISIRVGRNMLGNFNTLCHGLNCRNSYMNDIEKNAGQRIIQLEEALSHDDIVEMMVYYGRICFLNVICEIIASSKKYLINIVKENSFNESKWVFGFIKFLYLETEINIPELISLYKIVVNVNNTGMIGYELFLNLVNKLSEKDLAIISTYVMDAMNKFADKTIKHIEHMVDNYIRSNKLKSIYYENFYNSFNLMHQDIINSKKNDEKLIELKKIIELYKLNN